MPKCTGEFRSCAWSVLLGRRAESDALDFAEAGYLGVGAWIGVD
jgi:hypothetical protein